MLKFKTKLYRDVYHYTLALTAILVLAGLTRGAAAVILALSGAVFLMQRKTGLAAICFILFPTLTGFNRVIIGTNSLTLMAARFGNLFMMGVMFLTAVGNRPRGRMEKLPITMIFAYIVAAAFSSIDGWMPLISFMKLTQFAMFIYSIILMSQQMQHSDKGLYQFRCAMLALAFIIIVGSACSYFVPAIGYSMEFQNASMWQLEFDEFQLEERAGEMLFSGLACHSQWLAPMVALSTSFVLCDMLLVEKKITMLHGGLLALSPILMFMTRSRGALLELIAVVGMGFFVCAPKAQLPSYIRNKLKQIMTMFVLLMVVAAVVAQIRGGLISKWLRKTGDVEGDDRSLTEAFTASRSSLIELNLNDFRENPLFGKGFQVVPWLKAMYESGRVTWYSAPIEKGVTPFVILGETGVVGAVVFLLFLCAFYGTCLKKKYLATMTGFTCVLVANLADNMIFAPAGLGGFEWIISCIGGFGTDIISARMTRGEWTGDGGGRQPVMYYRGLPG